MPICGCLQLAASPVAPNHLESVGNGTISDIDPSSLACSLAGGALSLNFTDVSYGPDGNMVMTRIYSYEGCCPPGTVMINSLHLFASNYVPLGVYAPLPSDAYPIGVAVWDGYHQVIAALKDGTLLETSLPSSTPAHLFASGGFPWPSFVQGGIVRVGPDGALYALQAGTRYDDGTVSAEYSIVRIAPLDIPTQATTWGRLKASYR